jgi:CRISPR-associated endonuclease/helicase Cas3
MAKISEEKMLERYDRILLLLRRHTDGMTEQEIADELNYDRRNVNNYLRELEQQGKLYKEGKYWSAHDYEGVMPRRPNLNPEEAVMLYLAARLLVKQSDRRNESAELLLVKFAQILSQDVKVGDSLEAAARELSQRPKQPEYEDVFRTIIQAYIYRRQVRILYRPYRGEAFETTFAPYMLEPSAIGLSTYAIGYSSVVGSLRTYKIERISSATLTRQEFAIPEDFPGLSLLRNAWSIFYGEAVTAVVLRFHPDVRRRVQESFWHSSQQLQDDPAMPGYLLFQVEVADTTDLKPWIRTWGANCEVLEPSELREEMMGESRRLAYLYGWKTSRAADDHSRFDDIFNR